MHDARARDIGSSNRPHKETKAQTRAIDVFWVNTKCLTILFRGGGRFVLAVQTSDPSTCLSSEIACRFAKKENLDQRLSFLYGSLL